MKQLYDLSLSGGKSFDTRESKAFSYAFSLFIQRVLLASGTERFMAGYQNRILSSRNAVQIPPNKSHVNLETCV